MEQDVQILKEWMNMHLSKAITIAKKELRDLDKIHFNLEGVEFRGAEDVIDDYLGSALILRGFGNTSNADGELVPLPQATYDLAVDGLRIETIAEHNIDLTTDRAHYTITVD